MIGIDIIEVKRIESSIAEFGYKFLNRIFSESEVKRGMMINNHNVRCRYFAKRFAAKEAYIKAAGKYYQMNLISVYNDAHGKPYFMVENKKSDIQLSISDDGDYAIATALILPK